MLVSHINLVSALLAKLREELAQKKVALADLAETARKNESDIDRIKEFVHGTHLEMTILSILEGTHDAGGFRTVQDTSRYFCSEARSDCSPRPALKSPLRSSEGGLSSRRAPTISKNRINPCIYMEDDYCSGAAYTRQKLLQPLPDYHFQHEILLETNNTQDKDRDYSSEEEGLPDRRGGRINFTYSDEQLNSKSALETLQKRSDVFNSGTTINLFKTTGRKVSSRRLPSGFSYQINTSSMKTL